jgi:hypothetical protein
VVHLPLHPNSLNKNISPQRHKDTKKSILSFVSLWFIFPLKRNPLDAVPDELSVEVDQQPQPVTRQLQVRQHLGLMHRQQLLHGFDFHDQTTVHHHIQPKAGIQPHSIIDDGERDLPLDTTLSLLKFISQAHLIHTLQEAGPESGMNGESGIDNRRGSAIRRLRNRP